MNDNAVLERYRELRSYIGWTEEDSALVQSVAGVLDASLPSLIEDFYEEIGRHEETRRAITGGEAQVTRLKGTLLDWLRELLTGRDDVDYVLRRWRVGYRHVEIGLDQVFADAAMARLRAGLATLTRRLWQGDADRLFATLAAIDKRVDLDLVLIQDAYQFAFMARLRRNERFATLGQVAGGVAHELRNPLNVIRTSVYYLLNARSASQEKQREHLERIERNVELSDGVISALSGFAKQPVPDLRPVAIEGLIAETLSASPLRDGIDLRLSVPAGTPPILGDAAQLKIVLGNLVRNAQDAMPDGGRLTIAASVEGNSVDLSVIDTGVGIPADALTRVMEPLYSTKARGLGLGLAIARALAEKGQATLRVTSEPGHGSVFTVRVPAAPVEGDARS